MYIFLGYNFISVRYQVIIYTKIIIEVQVSYIAVTIRLVTESQFPLVQTSYTCIHACHNCMYGSRFINFGLSKFPIEHQEQWLYAFYLLLGKSQRGNQEEAVTVQGSMGAEYHIITSQSQDVILSHWYDCEHLH